MRRQLGTVTYLWWGASWGLSGTCDAERAWGCHIPVMGREVEAVTHLWWEERWGLSITCDGERDGGTLSVNYRCWRFKLTYHLQSNLLKLDSWVSSLPQETESVKACTCWEAAFPSLPSMLPMGVDGKELGWWWGTWSLLTYLCLRYSLTLHVTPLFFLTCTSDVVSQVYEFLFSVT